MNRRFLLFLVFVLTVLLSITAYGIFLEQPKLKVSFLNVGQGDAILIESPTKTQVLIDGGRDRSVLRELGKRMSPLDRSIDMVVETHPDADHIGGLSGVLKNYTVSYVLSSKVESDTNTVLALADAVANEKGVVEVTARRGQRIDIGGGAYLLVLFPDREVERLETNTGSVVMQLVYGSTKIMLTGDAPSSVEEWLVRLDGEDLESAVLKAGHHGSRTSTSDAWLAMVNPAHVVISAGKDNSYGHPHKEVLERIEISGADTLSTVKGAVRLESDGKEIRFK